MLEPARLDRRGYYRSPVTFSEVRLGRAPANKGKRYPVEVLTPAEARAIIGACGRGAAGARDRAGLALMYRAGLRIAELLALMPKDLDLAGGMVTILHGKGDRRRTVPVDPQAMALVELWLERRRELGLNGRHPFFCTISQPNPGEPYWDSVVRKKLKQAAARAGIEKRVHPHGLRHTYATELAKEGVPVHVIKALLGHNSLDTTERYIAKLYPAELAAHIHSRQWDPGLSHEDHPAMAC